MTDQNELPPVPTLTEERIDYIAEHTVKGMPEGIRGFTKVWGWQQFAQQLLSNFNGMMREYAQSAIAERIRTAVPDLYAHELISSDEPNGIWVACDDYEIIKLSHVDGETSDEIIALYRHPQVPLPEDVIRDAQRYRVATAAGFSFGKRTKGTTAWLSEADVDELGK